LPDLVILDDVLLIACHIYCSSSLCIRSVFLFFASRPMRLFAFRFRSTWAARFLSVLANRLKYSFYSSGSVSWFRGLIQSSFMRLSQLRTIPTR